MFTTARLKLTLFYVLIIALIMGSVSVAFYMRTSTMIRKEYSRIEQKLQQQFLNQLFPNRLQSARIILAQDYEIAKQQLITQLVIINGVLLIIIGVGGFALSGITLAPIQQTLEQHKRFVADAAHELRTPITALKTSQEVNLLNKKLPKATRQILQDNLQDLDNLEKLTESLFKLTKVADQGLELTPTALKSIVDKAVKHIKPLALQNKITISSTIDPKVRVMAEAGSLFDVLFSLLDNAIKYSPENSTITITARTSRTCVYISITDQGVGIDPKHLPYIFDRFYRADASRHHAKGYGLGLSVAKKIVEEHHGTISVLSQVAKGSTFTIKLTKA